MKKPTPLQQQQRELAWLLRIVTGAIANLQSACSRSHDIPQQTRQELNQTFLSLMQQERQLRSSLNNIQELPRDRKLNPPLPRR